MATTIKLKPESTPKVDTAISGSPSNIILRRMSSTISEYNPDSDEEIYRDDEREQPLYRHSFGKPQSRHTTAAHNQIAGNPPTPRNNTESSNVHYVSLPAAETQRANNGELSPQQHIKDFWTQLVLYIVYNSMRFLCIGIIIFGVSYDHQQSIQSFHTGNDNTVCCLCYNYAAQDSAATYKRLDWSMCFEACDSCHSCQSVDDTNNQCKYVQPTLAPVSETVDEEDESNSNSISTAHRKSCPQKLSITSFRFWTKNYNLYGIGALAVTAAYTVFMIVCVMVNGAQFLLNSAVIYIFLNTVVSLICAYCISKPYQYYLHEYTWQGNTFECYTDSLSEGLESLLTLLVQCSVAFVLLPFLLCCCRCITLRRESYQLQRIYGMVMRGVLVIAVIGCLLASVCLIFISVRVAMRQAATGDEAWKVHVVTLLIVVDSVMVFSVFDICICCPFCRRKLVTIYQVKNAPYLTQKNWELTKSDTNLTKSTVPLRMSVNNDA